MHLKLLPPPRVWQKTAPVFGGRTVPRPLPHHPCPPQQGETMQTAPHEVKVCTFTIGKKPAIL